MSAILMHPRDGFPGLLAAVLVAALVPAFLGAGESFLPPRANREASSTLSPAPATAWRPGTRPVRDEYLESTDLRSFVDRHFERLGDPETAFYVSQALEDCLVNRNIADDERFSDQERDAARRLGEHCRGFDGVKIEPQWIVDMLRYAAGWGEPHAIARTLLFRDAGAPKDDVLGSLPWMLTSNDPTIVRDVGAFLSRGDAQWRYGTEQVPTAIAAIAWDLVACDLDRYCHPWSRFGLSQCALLGRCATGRYEDAVATFEAPELMAQARVLRFGIMRALQDHDWAWLGLDPRPPH